MIYSPDVKYDSRYYASQNNMNTICNIGKIQKTTQFEFNESSFGRDRQGIGRRFHRGRNHRRCRGSFSRGGHFARYNDGNRYQHCHQHSHHYRDQRCYDISNTNHYFCYYYGQHGTGQLLPTCSLFFLYLFSIDECLVRDLRPQLAGRQQTDQGGRPDLADRCLHIPG
jgi:hypothetical protein